MRVCVCVCVRVCRYTHTETFWHMRAVLRQHGAKHSLFYAVEEKMLELVEDLIKEGADVNYKNHVSLHRVLSASVCIDGYVNDSSHGNVHMHWRVGHTCARCAYVSLSL